MFLGCQPFILELLELRKDKWIPTWLFLDDSHIDPSFGELESGGDPYDASSDDDCTPGSAESFLVIRDPIQTLISQIKGNRRTDANTGK